MTLSNKSSNILRSVIEGLLGRFLAEAMPQIFDHGRQERKGNDHDHDLFNVILQFYAESVLDYPAKK